MCDIARCSLSLVERLLFVFLFLFVTLSIHTKIIIYIFRDISQVLSVFKEKSERT